LLSDEHFTVDGTLMEAWASRRSLQKKAEPPQRGTGARGRKLLRDTHESSLLTAGTVLAKLLYLQGGNSILEVTEIRI
jgi:hypothetical protein